MDIDKAATAKQFWNDIIQETWKVSPSKLIFPKTDELGKPLPRPEDSGFLEKGIGEFHNQIADWRTSFNNTIESFHAVEFEDRYECHIDEIDPNKDPVRHALGSAQVQTAVKVITIGLIAGVVIYYLMKKQ